MRSIGQYILQCIVIAINSLGAYALGMYALTASLPYSLKMASFFAAGGIGLGMIAVFQIITLLGYTLLMFGRAFLYLLRVKIRTYRTPEFYRAFYTSLRSES